MHEYQVILGNWDDVSLSHASELRGHRVEIRVLDPESPGSRTKMIRQGMFPELLAVSDEDFNLAEWHLAVEGEV